MLVCALVFHISQIIINSKSLCIWKIKDMKQKYNQTKKKPKQTKNKQERDKAPILQNGVECKSNQAK